MKSIRIDRGLRLKEQPETGHNRWHPDIRPVLEVGPERRSWSRRATRETGKFVRARRSPILPRRIRNPATR